MNPRWLPLLATAYCTVACGGSSAPPATTASPEPVRTAAPAADTAAANTPAEPPPEPAATETKADEPKPSPGSAESGAQKESKGRNLTYRMTANGLVIDVEGLRLEPRAEPVKANGGWKLKLVLKTEVTDNHLHRLMNPENGPLMVAVEVDENGKKERFADERKGDTEAFLTAGDAPIERQLEQRIVAGQSLTAYVGLWGLGLDAEDRKPIRKLFVVKMVAGNKTPQPVVVAPE